MVDSATRTNRGNEGGRGRLPVGAERFELVRALANLYSGSRAYVFEGGCLRLTTSSTGRMRTALADKIAEAVDFRRRSEIIDALAHALGG